MALSKITIEHLSFLNKWRRETLQEHDSFPMSEVKVILEGVK